MRLTPLLTAAVLVAAPVAATALPASAATCTTRCLVASITALDPLSAREAVAIETPAAVATCRIVVATLTRQTIRRIMDNETVYIDLIAAARIPPDAHHSPIERGRSTPE